MIKESFKFKMSSDCGESQVFGIVQDVSVQLAIQFTLSPAGVNGDDVNIYIAYSEVKGKISLTDVVLQGNQDHADTKELTIDPGVERVITLSCGVPHATDQSDNSELGLNGVWSIEIPGCFKSGFNESLQNINGKFYKTSGLVFDVKTKVQF